MASNCIDSNYGKYILNESASMADDFLHGCFRIPHDALPKWLLVLTAYVDESGQEQDDWMFLAGFYGDDAAWKRVASDWPTALGPQRKHLHINTLKFKYQSEKRMLESRGDTRTMRTYPHSGGLRQSDFKDLIIGHEEEGVLSGYVICLWAMLFDALRSVPPGERLEVVFERQDRFSYYGNVALETPISEPNVWMDLPDGTRKLASWRYVDKSSTSLLEPSDYFAFALSKSWRQPRTSRDQINYEWCKPILATREGKGFGTILTRDQVRKGISDELLLRMMEDAKRRLGGIV